MALFLSTFEKKIDKKGRVSVPASFRAVLASEAFNGMVAYASFINPCIEACSMSRMEQMSERIETLDPFSEEKDAFAAAILGGAAQLSFDGEGRVMLPELLLEESKIASEIVFVGKGQTFEMWEPKSYAAYAKESRKMALERRGHLRAKQGGAE